jgi:arabinofuranosyltransferase
MRNCRETPRALVKAIAIGAMPAVAWTLFSLYYYGFPFPNTAYAKLGAGIPINERVIQGGKYLLDSAMRDYVTLPFVIVGMVIGFRGSRPDKALAGGSLFYLAFVISTGGDFMSGRFLTVPLPRRPSSCLAQRFPDDTYRSRPSRSVRWRWPRSMRRS